MDLSIAEKSTSSHIYLGYCCYVRNRNAYTAPILLARPRLIPKTQGSNVSKCLRRSIVQLVLLLTNLLYDDCL